MVRTRKQVAEAPDPPTPTPIPRQRRTRKRDTNPPPPADTNQTNHNLAPPGIQVLPNNGPEPSQQQATQQQLAQQLITLAQTLSSQASNAQANSGPDPRLPAPKHIPPPKLASPDGMTVYNFRDWKQRWNDFTSTQQIMQYPIEAQHGILRAAIDKEWTMLWNSSRLKIQQDSTLPEVLKLMESYIRRKRNPLLDRQEFHRRDQMAGESVDRYYASLKVLDDACGHEYELICFQCLTQQAANTAVCACGGQLHLEQQLQDIRIRDRFICGLRDKDMQRKVLAEQHDEGLTMDKVLAICTAVENSYSAGTTLGQCRTMYTDINAATSTYKNQMRPEKIQNPQTKGFPINKCKWCGGGRHRYEHCPARSVKCNYCKRTGHYEAVCFQKQRTVNIIDENPRSPSFRHGATMSNNVTIFKAGKSDNLIEIPTKIGEETYYLKWLPDTGADVDAISIKDVSILGPRAKSQLTTEVQEVYAANGESLGPVGSIHAVLEMNNKKYHTTVRVFQNLTTPLLSKSGCIALGFINPNWPRSLLTAKSKEVKDITISTADSHTDVIKKQIMNDLSDAFDDTVLRPMTGAPMKIDLVPDAKPCRRYKAYTIPFHWRDQVKNQLDDMIAKGIIEAVPVGEPVDWCHPMVIVPKKGTSEPRITVDLTGLNQYVRRPVYPVKVPREAVARIPPGNKYFTTLDARHGYWQVPLDNDSKRLTTFITPWGCFRFLRNVMGLVSAGDEHNRRGDEAIIGINNVEKIVEDIIIYDKELETHTNRVREVITRCQQHGITLNKKKFAFAQSEVEWCGFRITQEGYTTAPHLTQALSSFPVPRSKTDVRSFCGLVQQFEAFSTKISELALPIRALLPKKAVFIWESLHQQAFEALIAELSSPRVLAQFNPLRPVRLETDGAQSKGLGFALWQQQDDGTWKLLQAGSRFVTPTEARYSATEIELLAVVWAVKKCRMFLLGKPFELVVDHRPLTAIINSKTLDEIENPRLQRLKEKLACFRPQVVWRAGKQHIVVDAFSRYPASCPTGDEAAEDDIEVPINFAVTLMEAEDGSKILQDPILESVSEAGSICSEYNRLKDLINSGFPTCKHKLDVDLRAYWKIKDDLSVENGLILWGNRMLIPPALRRNVLETLHASHQGQDRTLRRARQAVFWPNISNDVKNMIRGCNECATHLPSQQKEPLLVEPPSTRPFQCVGIDLFKYAGYEYLVMVDRFSGWLNVAKCGRSTDSSRVIYILKRWMADFGIPEKIISDNGPQFSSLEFKNWLKKWGITRDPSSPHYPQANGLAESGVKAASYLLAKTSPNGDLDNEAFQLGLLELRNTPRADGRSPAQLIFGLPIRSRLPLHRGRFAREWRHQMADADHRASKLMEKATHYYNSTAKPLPPLKCGDLIRVQDPISKKWDKIGQVIDTHGRGRSYTIRTDSGRVFWRNRRFLRRFFAGPDRNPEDQPTKPSEPRRSSRRRQAPRRFPNALQLDQRSNSKGGHEVCSPLLPRIDSESHREQLNSSHA